MKPIRLLALLTVSSALAAVAGQAATLADDSPFLPSGSAGNQGIAINPNSSVPLELRGAMSGPSGLEFFCVYDPVKKHGVWAGKNDTDNSFTIIAGDAKEGFVDIRMDDGRLLHLKMRETKIQAGGFNPAAASASVADAGVEPGRVPAGLNEAQLAWRAEYNRRVAENEAKSRSLP